MASHLKTTRSALSTFKYFALASAVSALAVGLGPEAARAGQPAQRFEIAAQPLAQALHEFSRQANVDVMAASGLVEGKQAPAITGVLSPGDVLARLLAGSGLKFSFEANGAIIIRPAREERGDHSRLNGGTRMAQVQTGLQAQESPAQPSSTPTAREEPRGLEEIVVTARRRLESLQETPVSVMALSGVALEKMNTDDLISLSNFIPNVSFGGSGSGPTGAFFSIRGLGQTRSVADAEAPVALYINDVFIGTQDGSVLPVVEPERVEVLRGPQGTLFGKNALAGAINYITPEPGEEFAAEAKLSFGRFNRVDVKAWADIPLADTLFFRATGAILTRDGFIKNVFDSKGNNRPKEADVDTRYLRGDVLWKPFAGYEFLLGVDFMGIDNNGPGIGLFDPDFSNPTLQRFIDAGFDLPAEEDGNLRTNSTQSDNFWDQDIFSVTLRQNATLASWLDLKSITAYRRSEVDQAVDRDGLSVRLNEEISFRPHEQFSQEIQFLGNNFDDRLTWVAGFFFFFENASDVRARFSSPEFGNPPNEQDVFERTFSWAGWWEGTYALPEQVSLLGEEWSVTFGGRGTYERKRNFLVVGGGASGSFVSFAEGNREDFDDFSPRVILQSQWTPDFMTYFSWSKSFKSGGFNTSPNTALPDNGLSPFGKEKITNYEAGFRSEWFDGLLRLNATGFHSEYDGVQRIAFSTLSTGALVATTQNAGFADLNGVEVDGLVDLYGFRLNFGFGWTDAEFEDVGMARGITVDTPFPRAPEFSYNIGGEYEYRFGGGHTIFVRADWGWKDDFTLDDTGQIVQDSFGLVNSRLEYTTPSGRWTLAVWGNNLSDKRHLTSGSPQFGGTRTTIGTPREWGFTLSWAY